MVKLDKYEKILDLCKRRGLFSQSAEIYGGVAGFIDYGPIGSRLKDNLVRLWKKLFIDSHPDLIYEVETPIITPEPIFKASGHVDHFTDPITQCLACKRVFRADHVLEEKGIKAESLTDEELVVYYTKGVECPVCGGKLDTPKRFNLLFKTTIGPYTSSIGYVRAETAQGMFTLFKRAYEVLREKRVFGLAQVGRVGRNEISPRQGPIRLREFTQMELEFFFDPQDTDQVKPFLNDVASESLRLMFANGEKIEEIALKEAITRNIIASPWLGYFMILGKKFLLELGIDLDSQYFLEVPKWKLPHYSKQTWDLMVNVDKWGWIEVAGYSYRGDYDLRAHSEMSGVDLRVFKPYQSPVRLKKLKLIWDADRLKEKFGKKTGSIISKLKTLSEAQMKAAIEKGYVEIENEKIPIGELKVIEEETEEYGEKIFLHVVEPSFGVDRLFYVMIDKAYTEKENRVVLKIPRKLAIPQVGVLPLVTKDGLDRVAREIFKTISKAGIIVTYDEEGAIGRRYARLDEIGVPLAITVDYQTLLDGSVTFRDRDSWRQVRVKKEEIISAIKSFVYDDAKLETLGEPFFIESDARINNG